MQGARAKTWRMNSQASVSVRDRFNRIADQVTEALGSLPALIGSVVLVIVWAISGPLFNYADTWQLFINTVTTVITFWMVFVIQASANRQGKATQLKLDEIIRSLSEARNEFIALDRATDEDLAKHQEEFQTLTSELAERDEDHVIAEHGGAKTPQIDGR
jgi:low affinity Fe/Cu permease